MTDIYNHLARNDFSQMDSKTLNEVRNQSEAAFDGIMSGIQSMGSMAFWATGGENYSDDLAAKDLRSLGEALMYLPRIAAALNDNAQNAQFEIWHREGFPKW
ncbi:hypothetical protein A6J66_017310 [Yersinia enterocolitica]|nr:hypothetical protein A6J66_017310 [Yersinia enterocolitica]